MATEDLLYRQSTQYRLWSFSVGELASLREKTNALARQNIADRLTTSSTANSSGNNTNTSAPTSSTNTPDPPESTALPEFLTQSDEAQLLTFYTVELLRAANFIELPTDIRATAAIFLRRFYVTNSLMTYPPTELLKTCLFFGAKAEGFYTRLNKFAEKFPNTSPEEILAGEFLLCQGIRFAFDVKHPYRALEGAAMELRRYEDIEEKRIAAAHNRAREILKFSPLVTDAYFHYTPSQIMLASLSLADHGLVERLLEETFRQSKSQKENGADNGTGKENKKAGGAAAEKAKINSAEIKDKVLSAIEACRNVLSKEPPERMTEFWGAPDSNKIIKPLIRKLKKCRDPDRWDLVALQKARREHASKKSGRSAAVGGGDDDDDDEMVFGNPTSGTAAAADRDARDAKRRKVSSRPLDDPFGGPL